MDVRLLEPCEVCKDCYKIFVGIDNGFRMLEKGDYSGFGVFEFYLEKLCDYEPDTGFDMEKHMKLYCKNCSISSILDKKTGKELLDVMKFYNSMSNFFSEEEKIEDMKDIIKEHVNE